METYETLYTRFRSDPLPDKKSYANDFLCQGVAYIGKTADPISDREAARCLAMASRLGSVDANFRLGHLYRFGRGVKKSAKRAYRQFRKAAEHGHTEAAYWAGRLLKEEPEFQWMAPKAVYWWIVAASRGSTRAYALLADCFEKGHGVPPSHNVAASFLSKSAQPGDKAAKDTARNPSDVPSVIDSPESDAFVRKIMNADADIFLGWGDWFFDRRSGSGSGSYAFGWYKEAAARGSVTALARLADCYLYGIGTNISLETAMQYRAAAEMRSESSAAAPDDTSASEDASAPANPPDRPLTPPVTPPSDAVRLTDIPDSFTGIEDWAVRTWENVLKGNPAECRRFAFGAQNPDENLRRPYTSILTRECENIRSLLMLRQANRLSAAKEARLMPWITEFSKIVSAFAVRSRLARILYDYGKEVQLKGPGSYTESLKESLRWYQQAEKLGDLHAGNAIVQVENRLKEMGFGTPPPPPPPQPSPQSQPSLQPQPSPLPPPPPSSPQPPPLPLPPSSSPTITAKELLSRSRQLVDEAQTLSRQSVSLMTQSMEILKKNSEIMEEIQSLLHSIDTIQATPPQPQPVIERTGPGSFRALAEIHRKKFDNTPTSGQIRKANLPRRNMRFVPIVYLESAIAAVEQMPQRTLEEILDKAVEMYIVHPFEDGNLCCMYDWINGMLEAECGQTISWAHLFNQEHGDIVSAFRHAANGKKDPLLSLILPAVYPCR